MGMQIRGGGSPESSQQGAARDQRRPGNDGLAAGLAGSVEYELRGCKCSERPHHRRRPPQGCGDPRRATGHSSGCRTLLTTARPASPAPLRSDGCNTAKSKPPTSALPSKCCMSACSVSAVTVSCTAPESMALVSATPTWKKGERVRLGPGNGEEHRHCGDCRNGPP